MPLNHHKDPIALDQNGCELPKYGKIRHITRLGKILHTCIPIVLPLFELILKLPENERNLLIQNIKSSYLESDI